MKLHVEVVDVQVEEFLDPVEYRSSRLGQAAHVILGQLAEFDRGAVLTNPVGGIRPDQDYLANAASSGSLQMEAFNLRLWGNPVQFLRTMKTAAHFTCMALLLGLTAASTLFATGPSQADGRVTVIFSHPEKYTDLRDNQSDFDNELGRERYLPFIKEYLEQEANRKLPVGQKLTITFSDIDLAGDFEPWHGPQFDDVRIVKDLYVPRLTFTFKITDANGTVVREGERKLVELAFQMRITQGFRDDQLRYEKGMLSDWLRDELRPARKKS